MAGLVLSQCHRLVRSVASMKRIDGRRVAFAVAMLALARCMRANGLPRWPDPTSGGAFDKSELQATGYGQAEVRAVEDGPCKNTLPTAAPSTSASPTISVQQQQDYINAVACMRSHGFTNFADPTFSEGHVTLVPPPGVDTNSAQFAQAQHTCQQLIPTGLPYGGSDR
jgi:hypothetical protein